MGAESPSAARGRDWGLEIADWGFEIRDTRPACGRCAKQTQSLYMLRPRHFRGTTCVRRGAGSEKQSQSARPGAAIGDCRFGIGDSRARASGGSDAWCAKQSQSAPFGYVGASSVRGSRYQIRDSRYASRIWTGCQTKPIFAVFGARMEVPSENKANLAAPAPCPCGSV
jgi:hypothetical protein